MLKVGDDGEPCDDVAAGRGTVGVDDQHGDFPDVGGRRVGEQEQLEDRRDDHDEQQTRIPSELDHLLPHQESGAPHRQLHCRRSRTDASVSTTPENTASATRSRQTTSTPTPFSRIPRSAVRK